MVWPDSYGLPDVEMKTRIPHPPLRYGVAALVCLLWLGGIGFVNAGDDQFPTPVAVSLAASFSSITEGQTLRQVCGSMSQACDLVIYLDRRIDPDQRLAAEIAGPTVADALTQICLPLSCSWCPVDELVIIGPAAEIGIAGTNMLIEWHNLSASSSAVRRGLTEQHAVSWPKLATPDEVLKEIANTWKLDVSNVQLPHDHFPETDLGEVRVTTAIGALLSGFELGFHIIPESGVVEILPTEKYANKRLERKYPDVSLSIADRNLVVRDITESDVTVLKRAAGGWLLSGSAENHGRMEQLLLRAGNRTKAGRGRVEGVQKTYSLRLENKPAKAVLETLCRQGNLELEFENPMDQRLETVISLTAEKETLENLIAKVAQSAGLQAILQSSKVRIASPEP